SKRDWSSTCALPIWADFLVERRCQTTTTKTVRCCRDLRIPRLRARLYVTQGALAASVGAGFPTEGGVVGTPVPWTQPDHTADVASRRPSNVQAKRLGWRHWERSASPPGSPPAADTRAAGRFHSFVFRSRGIVLGVGVGGPYVWFGRRDR